MENSPVRPYKTVVVDAGDPGYVNRIMIGTACTSVVRVEWHQARTGQQTPANWSTVTMLQFIPSYMPLRFEVDDAQNMIVKAFIEKDFEWLLLYEHDVLPEADAFIRLHRYMQDAKNPVVSGLYYTRSRPSEPVLYRGRGTGCYRDWERGDKVWVDGVPTGFLLIHRAILKCMWDESPEYIIKRSNGAFVTRRVFETPRKQWFDPETNQFNQTRGTSDLAWCTRVMEGDFFTKSGWIDYADKEFPFLCDTEIFCRHISNDSGEIFP